MHIQKLHERENQVCCRTCTAGGLGLHLRGDCPRVDNAAMEKCLWKTTVSQACDWAVEQMFVQGVLSCVLLQGFLLVSLRGTKLCRMRQMVSMWNSPFLLVVLLVMLPLLLWRLLVFFFFFSPPYETGFYRILSVFGLLDEIRKRKENQINFLFLH